MTDRIERTAWFKALILPNEAALRRRLRAMRVADVEDVVSEALTRAYACENWRRMDQGRAFLFQIARNLLADAARRDAIVPIELMADLDALHLADARPDPEAAATARDELRRLQAVVDALPPQPRRVFLLRRVHDRSPAEIADELKLSVSTVEKHLAKAMIAVTRGLAQTQPLPGPAKGERAWRDATTKR